MSWEASTRYWFQFTKSFRSSSILNKEETLSQVLNTLQSSEKELIPAKVHLLSFLQQHAQTLIDSPSRCQQTFDLLNKQLLELPCSNPQQNHLIEQIMVTISCLLIILDHSYFTNTLHQQVMQDYVNILLEIMRGTLTAKSSDSTDATDVTGSFRDLSQSFERGIVEVAGKTGIHFGGIQAKSQERSLRLCAAENLRELEENFPGLLESFYEEILALSQLELTHACQSYCTLATTILKHCRKIKKKSKKSERQITGTEKEPIFPLPYNVQAPPPKFQISENYTKPQISIWEQLALSEEKIEEQQFNFREIEREINYFHSCLELTTGWGTIDIIQNIISIIQPDKELIQKVFGELFERFRCTNFLPFLQIIILLVRKFPDQFQTHLDIVRASVLRFIDCCSLSSPAEQSLVLMWCSEIFPEIFPNLEGKFIQSIAPKSFDRLGVRIRKVFLQYQIQSWKMIGSDSKLDCSTVSLDYLKPLEVFRYFPSSHFATSGLLDILRFVVCSFPSTVPSICEFMRNLIIESPRFCSVYLQFLHSDDFRLPENVETNLLETACYVIRYEVSPCFLQGYLPLLEHLLSRPSVDPIPLLHQLYEMLQQIDLLKQDSWKLGNKIFAIIRLIIATHNFRTFFSILCDILEFMSEFFGFLDIRDRAAFYLRLIKHVSPDTLLSILSHDIIAKFEGSLNLPAPPPVDARVQSLESSQAMDVSEVHTHKFRLFCSFLDNSINDTFVVPWDIPEDALASWNDFRDEEGEEKKDYLWEYYIQYISSPLSPTITFPLPVEVTIEHDEVDEIEKAKLYSVMVEILPKDNTRSLYHPFTLIHIPVLSSKASKFHSQLLISPRKPIPVALQVSIGYEDKRGIHHTEALPDMKIRFVDLVFPLCFSSDITTKLQLDSSQLQSIFFDKLWNKEILNFNESAKSLKVIKISQSDIITKIDSCSMLSRLKVRTESNNDNTEDESKAIISFLGFLPPRYHIALQFHVFSCHCNIYLQSDNWLILPFLDSFLNDLFLSPEQ